MKKFVAAAAVLAAAIATLTAVPASADSVCAPITVDGQPIVCVDTTPIDQAVAQAEATALETAAQAEATAAEAVALAEATAGELASIVLGPLVPAINLAVAEEQCETAPGAPTGNLLLIDIVTPDQPTPPSNIQCSGTELTIPSFTGQPGPTQRVHVPQICLTTTGTCVGPVDQDVQVPLDPAALKLCQTPVTIFLGYENGVWGWYRVYGATTCNSIPV